ncbi:hypothetical protein DL95DRAFT_503826 [Leptodontidium sp. 2 PMI_412]|nr:hypothetical protein DL95DRAFT_503826 [Leptodontidium sp. 2 PMI_412]
MADPDRPIPTIESPTTFLFPPGETKDGEGNPRPSSSPSDRSRDPGSPGPSMMAPDSSLIQDSTSGTAAVSVRNASAFETNRRKTTVLTSVDPGTVASSRQSLHLSENKSRNRPKAGCLTCQKRKFKCDGKKPQCLDCIKGKRECIFQEQVTENQGKHQLDLKESNSHGSETSNSGGDNSSFAGKTTSPRASASVFGPTQRSTYGQPTVNYHAPRDSLSTSSKKASKSQNPRPSFNEQTETAVQRDSAGFGAENQGRPLLTPQHAQYSNAILAKHSSSNASSSNRPHPGRISKTDPANNEDGDTTDEEVPKLIPRHNQHLRADKLEDSIAYPQSKHHSPRSSQGKETPSPPHTEEVDDPETGDRTISWLREKPQLHPSNTQCQDPSLDDPTGTPSDPEANRDATVSLTEASTELSAPSTLSSRDRIQRDLQASGLLFPPPEEESTQEQDFRDRLAEHQARNLCEIDMCGRGESLVWPKDEGEGSEERKEERREKRLTARLLRKMLNEQNELDMKNVQEKRLETIREGSDEEGEESKIDFEKDSLNTVRGKVVAKPRIVELLFSDGMGTNMRVEVLNTYRFITEPGTEAVREPSADPDTDPGAVPPFPLSPMMRDSERAEDGDGDVDMKDHGGEVGRTESVKSGGKRRPASDSQEKKSENRPEKKRRSEDGTGDGDGRSEGTVWGNSVS